MSESRYRSLLIVLCCLLLGGCSVEPTHALAASNAVDRAQLFLDASRAMFALEPGFWMRGVGDLYYCALTLARMKNRALLLNRREKFHKSVWAVAPISYRKFFSERMKKLRETGDYDLAPLNGVSGLTAVTAVIDEGPDHFRLLLKDAQSHLDAQMDSCNGLPPCRICMATSGKICLRLDAKARLATLEQNLEILLRKELPDRLRSASTAPHPTDSSSDGTA